MVITTADGFQIWIIAVVLCLGVTISGIGVSGAPLEIEKNETPFPLELQPPLIDNLQDAVDSYGNPIKFSQPIETPDGRKVITADGIQFEIPNYASGITEIKKPIDNLLPPFIDPIAVALPNDADVNVDANDSAPQEYTLPDWLADFNDPDVGPGVPYTPSDDDNSLKILSWDLVPPQKQDPESSTPISHFGIGQQKNLHVTLSPGQSFAFNRNAQPTPITTTPRPITTTTTTTTTPRPTTTTTTTTTTTPRPTTTTTTTRRPPPTTTTTAAPFRFSSRNSGEIYALPGGNSITLPTWLEGYEDPELSVAVPFEVPEDNNEYNHTLSNDLLPPLEPFVDLKVLSVPGLKQSPAQVAPTSIPFTTPSTTTTTTTTTIRTTTTRKPLPTIPPFQFKFFTKQPVTPPSTTTQKTSFFTAPTATTTTESPIANRITQFTLKSAAQQPTGFTAALPTRPTPPPRPVLDTKFNPFFSSRGGFPTTTTTTTTTTEAPTTSTTEAFLFDSATIPSWLSDVKDPELGPGVPFTLAGSSDPQLIYNDLQAPSNQDDKQTIDGVTIQKSISSEIPSLSFLHNSILSQSVPTIQPFTATTVPEPSRLFTPPVVVVPDADADNANSQSQTNSYSNNNFPAVTEPTTKTTSKVTFEKSDQGKVISNSVFAPLPTQQSIKPIFGIAQQPAAPSGFTSATLTPTGFTKSTTAASDFTGKYTGSFGGAPGLLGGQNKPGYAIQPDGSIRDPDHTVRPTVRVAAPTVPVPVVVPVPTVERRIDVPIVGILPKPTVAAGPKRGYTGSFGGPPGVLVPFDNAKSA